mmetsp:Transcript_124937/g.361363  ORF Transcript_124937/g.361363 Transcript_124937/m.361363 type:complete len:233 (-) Transcript_124937:805-1503(-)
MRMSSTPESSSSVFPWTPATAPSKWFGSMPGSFGLAAAFFFRRGAPASPKPALSSKNNSPCALARAAVASKTATSSRPRGSPATSASLVMAAGEAKAAAASKTSTATEAAAARLWVHPLPASRLANVRLRSFLTLDASLRNSGISGTASNLADSAARKVSRTRSTTPLLPTPWARQRLTMRMPCKAAIKSPRYKAASAKAVAPKPISATGSTAPASRLSKAPSGATVTVWKR